MAAINTYYDNFYLENIVNDFYNSKLDLQQFATVDNNLQGTPGMSVKVHKYTATDGTQDVAIGEGNTESIVVSYAENPYYIKTAQSRFEYLDEEAMADPMVVPVGMQKAAADMFNHVNADITTELARATLNVTTATPDFASFVDASALLNIENLEGTYLYALVSIADMAKVRKSLKDELKYVEAFAKQGYIGTVAGVNVFTKKDLTAGTIYVATKEAVTIFNKQGTEIEQITKDKRGSADGNIRKNTIFTRKYYVTALTDATKAAKITISNG